MSERNNQPIPPNGDGLGERWHNIGKRPACRGRRVVVVTNPAASLAYIRFGGDSSVIASSVDMPVLPVSRVVLSVNTLITYGAAVFASGSGSILFTRGDGSVL